MLQLIEIVCTCTAGLHILPFLELSHVQEPVAVLSGQFKLGRQREHGLIEVSQYGFDRGSVFMAVVDVIVQADELPVGDQ